MIYECLDCQCKFDDFHRMHVHISRSGHVATDVITGETFQTFIGPIEKTDWNSNDNDDRPR